MITLKINHQKVTVPEGTPVMKAARMLEIDIPNLCWHEDLEHFTSCMLCLVKDHNTGKLFPSCSVEAVEGMEIITDDDEIFEGRKTALELLLSEHVGDCEAPCQPACPAHMNIPLMNRLIAEGEWGQARRVVMKDIALPSVLGRICPAPCEGACHRKTVDEPVSICLLKRFAGDEGDGYHAEPLQKTGKKVAVIGAGPAGLSAAYYLQLKGIGVTLFDENEEPGGQLRIKIPEERLPREVLDMEIDQLMRTGILFKGGKRVGTEQFEALAREFDAVIMATGTIGEQSEIFDLKTGPRGIAADRHTYQTSREHVFAIGNALRSSKLAVRSVGQGKEVAFSVEQYLNHQPLKGEPRLFNSRFGKLVREEYSEYLKESVPGKRIHPQKGSAAGFTREEAVAEAQRCLHCDCRAIDHCPFRIYCDGYKTDQRRFKTGGRRKITRQDTHPSLIYEPGKCIRCGICVRLTEKYREKFGFTFIGRGFDVEIGVPFNKELRLALTQTAVKVAQSCPTGAIALKT